MHQQVTMSWPRARSRAAGVREDRGAGACRKQRPPGRGEHRKQPVAGERQAACKDGPGHGPGADQRKARPGDQGLGGRQAEAVDDRSREAKGDAQNQDQAGERVGEHRRAAALKGKPAGPPWQ